MSISRLVDVLGAAGLRPGAREIAEAIWLAQHLRPADETPAENVETVTHSTPEQHHPEPVASTDPHPTDVPVGGRTSDPAAPLLRGHPLRAPASPGLADGPAVQRALRPLRRRVPSRRELVLDEAATASSAAGTGVLSPVLRPGRERWFDVVLAVDTAASMDLWHSLVTDLRATLVRTGAFRDVRAWRLVPSRQGFRIAAQEGRPGRDPRELVDGAGRRIFLVVTDGSSPAWHDGTGGATLEAWARTGPMAVIQPLPESLWSGTGLAPRRARIHSRGPGRASGSLHVVLRGRGFRGTGPVVPVLGPHATHLGAWAGLVAGDRDQMISMVGAISGRGTRPAPVAENRPAAPEVSLDRFRSSASPAAYRLATYLALVPLTLPAMQLVQHLTRTTPSALPEVLLGGLMVRKGKDTYEFHDGVREALLSEVRRSEATAVLDGISRYLSEHAGISPRTFPAVAGADDGDLLPATSTLAWLPRSVATRLGLLESPTPGAGTTDVPAVRQRRAFLLTDTGDQDPSGLRALLESPLGGGHIVHSSTDTGNRRATRLFDQFLATVEPDDTVLVLITGRVVGDGTGRFLMAANDHFTGRGIAFRKLSDRLDQTPAAQQIIVVDCVVSDAPADGPVFDEFSRPSTINRSVIGYAVPAAAAGQAVSVADLLVQGLHDDVIRREADGTVTVRAVYEHLKDRFLPSGSMTHLWSTQTRNTVMFPSVQPDGPDLDGTLTEQDVVGKRFKEVTYREGYDPEEVDDFLDLVVNEIRLRREALDGHPTDPGGPALSSSDVTESRFQATRFRKGYDQDEVDEFLDEVVATLDRFTEIGILPGGVTETSRAAGESFDQIVRGGPDPSSWKRAHPIDADDVWLLEQTAQHFSRTVRDRTGFGLVAGPGMTLQPALALSPWCQLIDLLETDPVALDWLVQRSFSSYQEPPGSVFLAESWEILQHYPGYHEIRDPLARLREQIRFQPRSTGTRIDESYGVGTMLFPDSRPNDFPAELAGFLNALSPGSPFALAFFTDGPGLMPGRVVRSLVEKQVSCRFLVRPVTAPDRKGLPPGCTIRLALGTSRAALDPNP